jgi:hypothetical protein
MFIMGTAGNALISELRAALNGRVITPGEDGYDEARAIFYGGFDYRLNHNIPPAIEGS